MRWTSLSAAGTSTALALAIGGCSSAGGSSPAVDGSTGTAVIRAACSLADPPSSAVPPPRGTVVGRTRGRVGVLLDGTDSATGEAPVVATTLTRALDDAGLTPVLRVTTGDPAGLVAESRALIDRGVRLLILDTRDAHTGDRVERVADRAGVRVIEYDRVNPGGTAGYLVGFDYEDIGMLQARTLIDCLAQQGAGDPRIIILNGDTDADDNAVLQAKGVHEVLDPLVSAGRASIVAEASVKGRHATAAAAAFDLALHASDGRVDAVVAADDVIAGGVLGVLTAAGRQDEVAVTGLGATAGGLRNIIEGRQTMTVYADPQSEADAAARLSAALISGRPQALAAMHLSPFSDPRSPARGLQAVLLPTRVVTQQNVGDVPTPEP
ncbi:MAG: substrate-binding domain-containing protein [Nocardioides sp.]